MDIEQYLTLKVGAENDNYLQGSTPAVLTSQISALYEAVMKYLNSDCVNQDAKQIKNAKQILMNKNKNVRLFVHKLLYAVVYNHLLLVLPVNGKYQYDAGLCKGACGYGINRVVAVLGNALILSNLAVEDIGMFPEEMLVEFWISFKSLANAQMQGTGINYNFKGKTCAVPAQPSRDSFEGYRQMGGQAGASHAENMLAGDIRI